MSSTIKNKKFLNQYLFMASSIMVIILGWLIISHNTNQTFVFPTIDKITQSIIKITFSKNILLLLFSILKTILCIVIGSLVSFGILFLYILKKETIGFFTPVISFIRVVPIFGIIIFLFLIFSAQLTPYIISILITIPLMVEALTTAFDNIDISITDALKLENINFTKKFFQMYLPLIFPYFLMVLIQSFGLGLKAMIMGEYLCYTPQSVGAILYNVRYDDSALLLAWLLIIFVVSLAIEVIIKIIQNKIKRAH